MQSIIEKLNTLKSVQPSEKLVVEMRKEVLSKTPVFCDLEHNYSKKSIFSLNNLFVKRMAVSFTALVFVLTGGLSVSYASKSSLPGDTLYSVKIASEDVVLAISSGDRKAEIEIEQAGKRLEEAVEISKNSSDVNQGEKLKKLIVNFEEKVNRAQDSLIKIEDNEKKAKSAKVVNAQTEKYTEVLAVTNKNLTDIVKSDVSETITNATNSNKKVNLDSLAIRIEAMTDKDKDEITAIVKKKVEEKTVPKKETNSDEADLDPSSDEADLNVPTDDIDPNSSSDEADLSPHSDLDDTNDAKEETEQDPEISEEIIKEAEGGVKKAQTIEEEREALTTMLDDLKNNPDETVTDDDSSDEKEGEVKGESDSSDEEDDDEEEGSEDNKKDDNEIAPVPVF
ncbi:MAG: DUF5667 domain-containing protein [Patescibacteria group bacterium]|nr:DUF5667 domain-containing protein [Patescibacteria group bacterium]